MEDANERLLQLEQRVAVLEQQLRIITNTFGKAAAVGGDPGAAFDSVAGLPGVLLPLAWLPENAIISLDGLAAILKRHPVNIRKAVNRGELPEPVRFMGHQSWTAGALIAHLNRRLEKRAKLSARRQERRDAAVARVTGNPRSLDAPGRDVL